MSKFLKPTKKIGKYLRELSVVVIGVAITLSLSYWISNSKERKDMALYLNAIKLELEDNIKSIDAEADYLEDWENYAIYLYSHTKESLHSDSIRGGYFTGLGTVKNIIFQTSAFEMFKGSGAMRLMNDKVLLQSLWKAYLNLEKVRLDINSYYEFKKEHLIKETQLRLAGKTVLIPLYDFFITYINYGALEGCKELSKELKETVLKLEKY
ncbi:MAG: hypothetical protein LBC68_11965 [Prevotellaceae bacterium]|jgi:hypothetical protein|nr:hypothetical protein [Prevotellaceae bacterium]